MHRNESSIIVHVLLRGAEELGGSGRFWYKVWVGLLLGVGWGCYNYPELRCGNLNPVYLEGGIPYPPPHPQSFYNVNFFNIIGYCPPLCCVGVICSHPSHTIPYFLFLLWLQLYCMLLMKCMRDTPAAVSHTLYLSSHTLPGCVLLVYISSLNHTQVFLYYPSYKITNTVLKVMYFNVQLDTVAYTNVC